MKKVSVEVNGNKITKEINDLDNQVSELKGSMSRINGRH